MDAETFNSILPILLAIVGSGFLSTIIVVANDWVKDYLQVRKEEQKRMFEIKEEIYQAVIKNIDFIYQQANFSQEEVNQKKKIFFENYRLMFLYSDDGTVKKINDTLNTLTTFRPADTTEMKEKKEKIASGFLALKKHFIKNTKLIPSDFLHIS